MSTPFERYAEVTARQERLREAMAAGVDPELADLYDTATQKLADEQAAIVGDTVAADAARQVVARSQGLVEQLGPLRGIVDEEILNERAARYTGQATTAAAFLVAHEATIGGGQTPAEEHSAAESPTLVDTPPPAAVRPIPRPPMQPPIPAVRGATVAPAAAAPPPQAALAPVAAEAIEAEVDADAIAAAMRALLSRVSIGATVRAEALGRAYTGDPPKGHSARGHTRRAIAALVSEGVLSHNGILGRGSGYIVNEQLPGQAGVEYADDPAGLFSMRDAGLLATQIVRFAETLRLKKIALPAEETITSILDAQPDRPEGMTEVELVQERLGALGRLGNLLQNRDLLAHARTLFGPDDPRSAFLEYLEAVVQPETQKLIGDLIASSKLLVVQVDGSKYAGEFLTEVSAKADRLDDDIPQRPAPRLDSVHADEEADVARLAAEVVTPAEFEARELRKLTRKLGVEENALAVAAYSRLKELRGMAQSGGLELTGQLYPISYLESMLCVAGLQGVVREARQAGVTSNKGNQISVDEAMKAILHHNQILETFVLTHGNGNDQLLDKLIGLAFANPAEVLGLTHAQRKSIHETTASIKAASIQAIAERTGELVQRFFAVDRGRNAGERMAPNSYKELLRDWRIDDLARLAIETGIIAVPETEESSDAWLKITLEEAILVSLFGDAEHNANIRRWPYDIKRAIDEIVEEGFTKQQQARMQRKSRARAGKGGSR